MVLFDKTEVNAEKVAPFGIFDQIIPKLFLFVVNVNFI